MSSNEPLGRLPVAHTYPVAPNVPLDADSDARWAAWVARGHAHDEIVRRRLGMVAVLLAIAAAILFAFLG